MDLPAARILIRRCADRMNTLYGAPVFDEWAVVEVRPTVGAVLSGYDGPRLDQFRTRFLADAHALSALLAGRSLSVGEFAFAPAAEGTAFDACVRLGEHSYLLCNDTERSMEEIRANPRWLQAQRPFFDLTEAFRLDPLVSR